MTQALDAEETSRLRRARADAHLLGEPAEHRERYLRLKGA